MTHQDQLKHSSGAMIRWQPVVGGAVIAFLVISFFVFGVDQPHPEWGDYWQVRPLIITPLAGAVGGAVFSFLTYLSSFMGFNRTIAIVLGVIIYVVGLWLGIVLGLAGTMWD